MAESLRKRKQMSRSIYWIQEFVRNSKQMKNVHNAVVTSAKVIKNPRIEPVESFTIVAQFTVPNANPDAATFATATFNLDKLIEYIEKESFL